MGEGFVPSYQDEEERLKVRKEKDRKDRIKSIIISVIASIVALGIIFLGYTIFNVDYSKYEKYEEKMDIYGFSKVYDNQKANTKEKVTKSEAVKMILSCLYNVSSIDGIAMPTEETYSNAIWVEYAIKQGIVSREEINASNANDKVKYQEVLVWLYNIKAKVLNIEPDTTANFNIKDINAYNADQKFAIYDLLNSQVIVENVKRVDGNRRLYKGKLNELIVNFAEEYNTITVGNAKININEDKIPENSNMYPYTLASVQKDVYEIPFKNNGNEGAIYPIDYYKDNKEYYGQIKTYVENYYNTLLNIDYNSIKAGDFKRKIKKYVYDEIDDNNISSYIEYVKNNHIKMSGKATAQLPCVYFDGQNYRVRVKLEIKIESSDTKDNLIYHDLESGKTSYNSDLITICVDTIMQKTDSSETLFIKEGTINSIISKSSSSIVSKED